MLERQLSRFFSLDNLTRDLQLRSTKKNRAPIVREEEGIQGHFETPPGTSVQRHIEEPIRTEGPEHHIHPDAVDAGTQIASRHSPQAVAGPP